MDDTTRRVITFECKTIKQFQVLKNAILTCPEFFNNKDIEYYIDCQDLYLKDLILKFIPNGIFKILDD